MKKVEQFIFDTPIINIKESALFLDGDFPGGIIGIRQENGEYPRINFKNAKSIKFYTSGIIVSGSANHIKNIIIENSNGNGISIFGSKNLFDHIITRYNQQDRKSVV